MRKMSYELSFDTHTHTHTHIHPPTHSNLYHMETFPLEDTSHNYFI